MAGFKVTLPQTEVILPTTGKSIRVLPLVLKHQLAIAESEVVTLSERYKFLLELFWDRIVSKDVFNNSYDIFLSSIYASDLAAIGYGIVSLTYKQPIPFLKICPKCGFVNNFEIPVKDIITDLNLNLGGKDQFYSEIHSFVDEDLNITYNVKLPTMSDNLKTLEFIESKNINLLQEGIKSDNADVFAIKVAPAAILPAIYSLKDPNGNELKNDLNSKNVLDQIFNVLVNDIPDITGITKFISELESKYFIKLGFNAICTNPNCSSYKNKKPEFYEVDVISDFFPVHTKKSGV